jgi:hypothetical protein
LICGILPPAIFILKGYKDGQCNPADGGGDFLQYSKEKCRRANGAAALFWFCPAPASGPGGADVIDENGENGDDADKDDKAAAATRQPLQAI